jgi:type IV pilus assembly protein PilQ
VSQGERHAIRDINFRRGKDGEGRLVVDLSDPTGIDIRQQGTSLIDFLKTEAPEQLRRKLDVSISAPRFPPCSPRPGRQRAHDRHAARPWEHNAYQSDNQFVLEVKPVKEDPNKLTQGSARAASAARSCRSTSRTSMSVRCCR